MVSGPGLGPSALSQVTGLHNMAVEAAQAPANNKSATTHLHRTSFEITLPKVALPGAERRAGTYFAWTSSPANEDDITAVTYRIRPIFRRAPGPEVGFGFIFDLGRAQLRARFTSMTDIVRRPACPKSAMYGRRPRCKRNLTFQRSVRVQPCIRPLNAAAMAAGPDVIR